MTDPVLKSLLKISLPLYNRDRYEIKEIKINPNEDETTNRIYLEVVTIKIEEKSIFPENLGNEEDRYAHGFCGWKEYSDQSMRGRLVVIHERDRRRRHKKTKEIGTSNQESVLRKGTKAPSDVLDFLKIGG